MPFLTPDNASRGHNGPQHELEPVAIVGLSLEFPGGCDTTEAFWETLIERRNTSTEAPKDRYSAENLWHPDASRRGTVALRGGHFLTRDIAKFDAPFFAISDTEAAALDPQQRGLLEATFRALENAGQPLDQVAGSNTSVFTGCFSDDWKFLSMKDSEQCASHAGLGIEPSMLANRLSWFFGFQGTSCNLDSACSSSLLAVDLACKSLASGDSDMSIAAGCNLLLYPDRIHGLSNLGLLSPDSQCYPFDARANGYARGDGFGVLVLKRLSDAIANNDVIRAVIRATGSNQDGRTPSVTQPSGEAQAALIQRTYARAGLSLAETRFVEAHQTGTQIGDPIEADAIGRTFRPYRSAEEPLIVGAVKGNIGHLEGASGVASIIKTVLVLEKGIIPPNANFQNLNPKIDLDFLRIKLPLEPTKWPSEGLRRASVNSFGFGGSNTHVVIDDAYHYLRARGLKGIHNTVVDPESSIDDDVHADSNGHPLSEEQHSPRLLTLSANDETTLKTQAITYAKHFDDLHATSLPHNEYLDDLSYTLGQRRSEFSCRSAAVLRSTKELTNLGTLLSGPVKAVDDPAVSFVFTGQGAQYPGGELRRLEQYDVFRRSLEDAENYLTELGCQWKARDELYKTKTESNIDRAEYSQPLSTIIQVALVDLLRSFGVFPKVVVGHSSGEIAAAYCCGALSARSAIKVAYFRGYHTAHVAAPEAQHGGMMAVALSAQDVMPYIEHLASETGAPKLTVACINSPKSVTISGDRHQIDLLESRLSKEAVFARKLEVDMAYHSVAMQAFAEPYLTSIRKLERGASPPHAITMLSTVTGEWVSEKRLRDPQYWVDNMISPVQFSPAVEKMTYQANRKVYKRLDCSHRNHPRATFMLELGFHGALRGPLRDILGKVSGGSRVPYRSVLVRDQSPLDTLLASMGQLFCHGYAVNLGAVNSVTNAVSRSPKLLCNLPQYQFNHGKSYWDECRIGERFRLHPQKKLDLLGKPTPDWNGAEAKWRNFIRVAEMPWVEDHKINGTTIYPGAGMLVMAIEAANQIANSEREVEGFELKDIKFLSALAVPRTSNGIETHLYLRESRSASTHETPWSEFRLFCYDRSRSEWSENCRGSIRAQYKAVLADATEISYTNTERFEELKLCLAREASIVDPDEHTFEHGSMYTCLRKSGFDFGPSFQLIRNGVFMGGQGKADVQLYEWPVDAYPQTHIVHPCTLDAMLHLSVAAFADGGRTTVPTAIPSGLRHLWIAKDGLSRDEAKEVRTNVWMTGSGGRDTQYGITTLDASGSKVLMRGEGLELTVVANVSTSTTTQSDEGQSCYHLMWKPDIDLMSERQLAAYCGTAPPFKNNPSQQYRDFNFVSIASLAKAIDILSSADTSTMSVQHLRYMDWAKEQLYKFRDGSLADAPANWIDLIADDNYVRQACQTVAETSEFGRVFVETARQLPSILRGEIEPHVELRAMSQGIDFSQDLSPSLTRYLEIVAHKDRRLAMLEIGSQEAAGLLSGPCFVEDSEVDFKVFDIYQSAGAQGFKQGSYDIVLAANVVGKNVEHVDIALRNVRGLLRAGGSLILHEVTRPNILRRQFISGLLPDWELEVQSLEPALWAEAFRRNGFDEIDLDTPISSALEYDERNVMVARASRVTNGTNGVNGVGKAPRPIVVADPSAYSQASVSTRLESVASEDYRRMSLHEAAQVESKADTSFVFLLELEAPKLMDLSKSEFADLQSLLTTCKSSLWVTNGGGHLSTSPSTGIADGLFRVLRNERPDRPHATLGLDVVASITDDQVGLIHKVFQTITHLHDPSTEDQEFVEMDGILHTPRVTESEDVSESLFQGTLARRTITQAIKSCPPVQLAIESIGFLDSVKFIEDDTYDRPLEPDEVEIEVRAAGLNFRDVLVALGRVPGNVFGSEAAGIVSRVGSSSLKVSPGDRVVMAAPGMRTFARAKAERVLKIDDDMTFSEAASIATQFCTAWQTVHELARLQPDESILIHTGAGGTGQAAIQVAQHIGATIFTTVGSEAKKRLLIEEYGIPETHIFYSRNTSFAKGVMRMTDQRGVDVVLNSLAGDSLVASWECIAPYGRFVEVGKKDILQNSSLPMYMFRRNASFIAFDGFGFAQERPKVFQKLFETVVNKVKEGVLRPAKPLHVFPFNQTEDAFRAMQDGKLAGKIVLEMTGEMELKATLATKPSFTIDNASTYVIAGGFGGVGRNIARWLTDRGAKHLLILSRSGAVKESAKDLVKELAARGVVVQAPACDVSDFGALQTIIEDCAQNMPPIKGCVQASMVLRDFTFDKMSYADWRSGTDCKTIGSWNLHKVLPRDLSFFVMVASASGVVGLHGQANYAAGNAYMDALARYRVSLGLRATSLDLGALTEDGLLAEDPEFLNRVLSYGALNGISRTYFNAIMDHYCNPSLPPQTPTHSQPIIGLCTGDSGIITSRQPMFRNLATSDTSTTVASSSKAQNWKAIFAGSANQDIASLVTAALIQKLAKTNSSLQGEIDFLKPLVAYGVDSLLAVELRSWLAKEFGADVALFEIQGGVGFESLGRIVAGRSSFNREL